VNSVLTEGMVVVDSSTISPSSTVRFAKKVRARGADYVDAPVTGSKTAAGDGTLVFIVGASEERIAQLQPLFDATYSTYAPLAAHSRGIVSLRNSCPHLRVAPVEILSERYSLCPPRCKRASFLPV